MLKWRDVLRDAGCARPSTAAVVPTDTQPQVALDAATLATIDASSSYATPRRKRANSDSSVVSPHVQAYANKGSLTAQKPSYARASPSYTQTGRNTAAASPAATSSVTSRFQALVDVLKERPSDPPPLRSFVSPLIPQRDQGAYARLGVKTWREYLDLAVSAGVVQIGVGDRAGTEWVRLKPSPTATTTTTTTNGASPSVSTPKLVRVPSKTKLSASALAVGVSTPSIASIVSTTPRKHVLPKLLSMNNSPETVQSFANQTYTPLIELLSSMPAQPAPLRYIVSTLLFLEHPEIQSQFGWKSYVSTAQDLGIVSLGGGLRSHEGGPETITLLKPRVSPSPPASSTSPPFATHTAELFAPLIDVVSSLPAPLDTNKVAALSRNKLAFMLVEQDPNVFAGVGASDKVSYFELARRMGVARLGAPKDGGREWLTLRKVGD